MEKTKLVRTFGTALATATLSFGLFAAPALAKTINVDSDEAVVFVGEDKGDVAKSGDTVKIEIPATITGVDTFENDGSKLVFKASNGTFEQELDLAYDEAGKKQAGTFWFELSDPDPLGQTHITKVCARFKVIDKFMNGTYKFDELYLNKVNGDEWSVKGLKASFVVDGNEDPKNLAADLENVTIAHKTVKRGGPWKDNWLNVQVRIDGAGYVDLEDATGTVKYLTPAGEEMKKDGRKTDMPGITFEGLNTQVDGTYTLQEITLKALLKEANGGKLYQTVTYDRDAFEEALEDGDYIVTKTGVEAMLRLYNPYTGEHLYTNDALEAIAAVSAGWIDEGLAWYAPMNELYGGAVAPVYRVYNQYNGEHHYTTSANEVLTLVAAGWTDEGVGFYTTTKGDKLAQPVYRLFNPYETIGTHHYTTGENERDAMVKAGWKDEGTGWYAVNVDLDD